MWQAVESLLADVQRLGFEYVFRRFPGVYRANVTDVRDPEKRGRIRALVPGIGTREPAQAWFEPIFPQAGANRGFFAPPQRGDSVWVVFENGDPSRPLAYLGGWFGNPSGRTEVPSELGYDTASPPNPRRFGWVGRLGHALFFDETPGAEKIEFRWHQPTEGDAARTDAARTADRASGKTTRVWVDAEGTLHLDTHAGGKVTLTATAQPVIQVEDAAGNRVTLDAAGIAVRAKSAGAVTVQADTVTIQSGSIALGEGASIPAVLGTQLQQWLLSHVHGTATGPTSAPLTPPTNILSRIVRLKG